MSSVGEEVRTVTSEDFGFKKLGQSTILPSYNEKLPFASLQNFDISNEQNKFIACSGGKIVFGELQILRDSIQNDSDSGFTFLWEGDLQNVIMVRIISEHTAIIVDKEGTVYSLNLKLLGELKLVYKFPSAIVKACWATRLESLLVLNGDGQLHSYTLSTGNLVELLGSISSFDIYGSDICTFGSDYSINSYKFDQKTAGAITNNYQILTPDNLISQDQHLPLSINFLDANQFLLIYGEPNSESDEDVMYEHKTFILDNSRDKPIFQESFDIVPAFGSVLRFPTCYNTALPDLIPDCNTVNILASSCSSEVTIWDSKEVIQPSQDSERAVLPISKLTDNDTNPIGTSLDVITTGTITNPCPGVDAIEELPLLYILNNEGSIQVVGLYHSSAIKQGKFNVRALRERILLENKQKIDVSASESANFTSTPTNDVSLGNLNIGDNSLAAESQPLAMAASQKENPFLAGRKLSVESGSAFGKPSFGSVNPASASGNPSFSGTESSSSSDKASFGSMESSSAFGRPSFGSKDTGSAFGKPSFGSTESDSASGKPLFGSATASSIFGKPSFGSAETGSAFGKPSFGGADAGSAFGKPLFGSADTSSTFGKPLFGSAGTSSTFGKPSFGGADAGSAFGKPLFGDSESSPHLGKPSFGSADSGSAVGKSSLGNDDFGSTFGKPSFGSTDSGSTFGKPSFGSAGTGSTIDKPSIAGQESNPLFGKAPFGNMESVSAYGKSPFTSTNAGSTFGKPSFGSTESSSAFGKLSLGSTEPSSTFGKPSFGSTKSNSAFDKDTGSAFGKPSFGSIDTGSALGKGSLGSVESGSTFGKSSFGDVGSVPSFGMLSSGNLPAITASNKPLFGGFANFSGNGPKAENPFISSSNKESPFAALSLQKKGSDKTQNESNSNPEIAVDKSASRLSDTNKSKSNFESSFKSQSDEQLPDEKPNPESAQSFNGQPSVDNPIQITQSPTKDGTRHINSSDFSEITAPGSKKSDKTAFGLAEPNETLSVASRGEGLSNSETESSPNVEDDSASEPEQESVCSSGAAQSDSSLSEESQNKKNSDTEENGSTTFSDSTIENTPSVPAVGASWKRAGSDKGNSISSITARIKENANVAANNFHTPDFEQISEKLNKSQSPFSSFAGDLNSASSSGLSFANLNSSKNEILEPAGLSNESGSASTFSAVDGTPDVISASEELPVSATNKNDLSENVESHFGTPGEAMPSTNQHLELGTKEGEKGSSQTEHLDKEEEEEEEEILTHDDGQSTDEETEGSRLPSDSENISGEESYDALDDITQDELESAIESDQGTTFRERPGTGSRIKTAAITEFAVQATPDMIPQGNQTEPLQLSDFDVQAFEEDEAYLALEHLPHPLKKYLTGAQLGQIKYHSNNSTTRSIEKSYYLICAEIDVLLENIKNTKDFIHDQSLDDLHGRSVRTLPNLYTWRISEAQKLNDIIISRKDSFSSLEDIRNIQDDICGLSDEQFQSLSNDMTRLKEVFDQLESYETKPELSDLKYHQLKMQSQLRGKMSEVSERLNSIGKSLQILKLCSVKDEKLEGNPFVEKLSKELSERPDLVSNIVRLREDVRRLSLRSTSDKIKENEEVHAPQVESEVIETTVVEVGLLLNTKRQFGNIFKKRAL